MIMSSSSFHEQLMGKYFITFLFWAFSSYSYADPAVSQDLLVIDAGSSHSELYAFRITSQGSGLPQVTHLYQAGSSLALNQQINSPNGVANWALDLTGNLPSTISADAPIYVMGTAGMRQLSSEQQTALYTAAKTELSNQSHHPINFAGTITGQQEGIYGWLTVNYLAGKLTGNSPTYGVLDMGGASTQITFESKDSPRSEDLVTLQLGQYRVQLFSHSFLGLGHNEALKQAANEYCYPTDTPLDNQKATFNYDYCALSTKRFLRTAEVSEIVPRVRGKTFVAMSGYYYTFDFFGSVNRPYQLKNHLLESCDLSWDELKIQNPNVPEAFLKTNCFTAIYDYTLLTKGYNDLISNNTILPRHTWDNADLDWTLGAALFLAMQNP